jgi:hypothetical protein
VVFGLGTLVLAFAAQARRGSLREGESKNQKSKIQDPRPKGDQSTDH